MPLKPHIVRHGSRDQIFLHGWSQGMRLAKSTVAPISRLFLPVIKEASSLGLVVGPTSSFPTKNGLQYRALLSSPLPIGFAIWWHMLHSTYDFHSSLTFGL